MVVVPGTGVLATAQIPGSPRTGRRPWGGDAVLGVVEILVDAVGLDVAGLVVDRLRDDAAGIGAGDAVVRVEVGQRRGQRGKRLRLAGAGAARARLEGHRRGLLLGPVAEGVLSPQRRRPVAGDPGRTASSSWGWDCRSGWWPRQPGGSACRN